MSCSGFLNILKPPGMTSHDVVDVVRRRLPKKTKVGHLGTLDSAAAGVLPLAIGSATKLIPLIPDLGSAMKAYLAHLRLGVTTSTDDLEGEVLRTASPELLKQITRQDLELALAAFRGTIAQVPPQVSAVRKDGVRAYERARSGETVELQARTVLVEELALLEFEPDSGFVKVFMVCGSGTYVRSLARDLGESLGVGGALAFLLRTHSGTFRLDTSISLEEFLAHAPDAYLRPLGFPFSSLPSTSIESFDQKGQTVTGPFESQGLLRSSKGLLRTDPENPDQAIVEAVFAEVST